MGTLDDPGLVTKPGRTTTAITIRRLSPYSGFRLAFSHFPVPDVQPPDAVEPYSVGHPAFIHLATKPARRSTAKKMS